MAGEVIVSEPTLIAWVEPEAPALLPLLGFAIALVLMGRLRSVPVERAAVAAIPFLDVGKAALLFEILYYGAHVIVFALLPLYLWLA